MTNKPDDPIAFGDIYQEAFIRHSHELLAMGYQRLTRQSLAKLEETDITGILSDEMNAVADAPDRPVWANHITVEDDPPETVRGKTGKRRPRTDIRISSTQRRPRGLFRFEAKRLNGTASLPKYLGDEGMLALITGHYGDLPAAGMIGYVQCESCNHWSKLIRNSIQKDPVRYRAKQPVNFGIHPYATPTPVFSTHHAYNGSRMITHTLLACC